MLLYCFIDPGKFDLSYDDCWQKQNYCWQILRSHPFLKGKTLPEKSESLAWDESIQGDFRAKLSAVVFVAEVKIHELRSEPLVKLILHPLKREKSCRLYRRFGSDRFL